MPHCLPQHDEFFACLELFQRRVVGISFPEYPHQLSRKEMDLFLQDPARTAHSRPDILALIFAALALGLQAGKYDMGGEVWAAGDLEAEKGDLYSKRWFRSCELVADLAVTAAMQSLRMSAFTSQPTLISIQALVMLGPYMTNNGRFLDAWSVFGLTFRLGQAIGLHRNPSHLDTAPSLRECTTRRTLWWWMLHMDQQYSMTLGRPLGISGIGDSPSPEPLTTDPTTLRLGHFVDQFTILGRQILSSSQLINGRIDSFTEKLTTLWDTMPAVLQFSRTWNEEDNGIPEWPLAAIATSESQDTP
ncbi:hypothetical protein M8818_006593 [Zalaria obscura]|uniref:Uncharacterized protein n=1 Tax=Zalaria obscura TaxID=2024903 RepID=A0ACC3S9C3_9PEZI